MKKIGLAFLGLWMILPVQAEDQQAQRAWEVYQLFESHCADCHGGHRKKPKGEFGYVLDLQRLTDRGDYIIPGEPEASELYLFLTEEDPEYLMPPPDSDVPALSTNEIQLVYDWILHGAGLRETATTNTTASVDEAALEEPPSRLSRAGNLHPLLVHFPIALLMVGLLAALVKGGRSEVATWCLGLGALGAIAAAVTGWVHAATAGYNPETVFNHRWLGVTTTVLALAAFWTHCLNEPESRRQKILALLLLLMLAVVVGLAGHTGGVLVYGEGFPF